MPRKSKVAFPLGSLRQSISWKSYESPTVSVWTAEWRTITAEQMRKSGQFADLRWTKGGHRYLPQPDKILAFEVRQDLPAWWNLRWDSENTYLCAEQGSEPDLDTGTTRHVFEEPLSEDLVGKIRTTGVLIYFTARHARGDRYGVPAYASHELALVMMSVKEYTGVQTILQVLDVDVDCTGDDGCTEPAGCVVLPVELAKELNAEWTARKLRGDKVLTDPDGEDA